MTITEFKDLLLVTIATYFPAAKVESIERRTAILQVRAIIDEETFAAVYFNALTDKKSYVLVYHKQRVMGYDNYKFWHHHPFDDPDVHAPCEEPSTEEVIAEMKSAVDKLVELSLTQRPSANGGWR
ncbi:MAG: hypothetical protein H8E47_10000 [Anaerolineales bacterium]|nr:hypothetical protein [Anaerolineales bacterium]